MSGNVGTAFPNFFHELTFFCQHRLLLPNEKEIVKSRFICQKLCFSTHTLTINSNGEACLPNDWPYMPLLSVLNNHTKPGSDQTKSEDLEIWFVQLSLQWIYYMNSTQKVFIPHVGVHLKMLFINKMLLNQGEPAAIPFKCGISTHEIIYCIFGYF